MSRVGYEELAIGSPQEAIGISAREKPNARGAEFRDVSENLPAGGYLATADDLVRFALACNAGKLVKPATRKEMLRHPVLADLDMQE